MELLLGEWVMSGFEGRLVTGLARAAVAHGEKVRPRGLSVKSLFLVAEHAGIPYIGGWMPSPYPAIDSRQVLMDALEASGWVLAHAARALGISRQTLYASMRRCRIVRRPMSQAYVIERARRARAARKSAA